MNLIACVDPRCSYRGNADYDGGWKTHFDYECPIEEVTVGKHSKDNAPGTAAQQKAQKEAAEKQAMKDLEKKLRKQGKIK